MILWIMTSLMFSFSVSMMLSTSPLILGLWVMIIALLVALICSMLTSSWFSFILFLIYIGGLLVMFAYFSALTPNQPLHISMMTLMLLLTMFSYLYVSYSMNLPNNSNLPLMMNNMTMTMLYMPSFSALMLILGAVLFIALVAVVKVSSSYLGPLRPFM
uniref:NADH dehydrogenase subunit 6 n=1 Tax=Laetmonice producta TaxID=2153329 RepID=A0A343W6E7_9ANNE|nr:NADH dehydrogenase subunit 6 [Laetmonice producta]